MRLRSPADPFRRNTTRIGSGKTGSDPPPLGRHKSPKNAGRSSHPKDLLWPTPEREFMRSKREHSVHMPPCKALFSILNPSSPLSAPRTVYVIDFPYFCLYLQSVDPLCPCAGLRPDIPGPCLLRHRAAHMAQRKAAAIPATLRRDLGMEKTGHADHHRLMTGGRKPLGQGAGRYRKNRVPPLPGPQPWREPDAAQGSAAASPTGRSGGIREGPPLG